MTSVTPRARWRHQRRRLEPLAAISTPLGVRFWPRLTPLERFLRLSVPVLRACGVLRVFRHSIREIRLTELELAFPHLPARFDGYRVLHLSDLHLDSDRYMPALLSKAVASVPSDLCVMTGDFGGEDESDWQRLVPMVATVVHSLPPPPDGVVAVLGNHDHHGLADGLDAIGIRVLINERLEIRRGAQAITLTGCDDVSRFFTPAARKAMTRPVEGFAIALVHSPEIADLAEQSGHALYLCGHTHGGQVCLPNGIPVFRRLVRFRSYVRGVWHHGAMTGVTSQGCGYSVLPMRTFSFPEIVRITLRCRR